MPSKEIIKTERDGGRGRERKRSEQHSLSAMLARFSVLFKESSRTHPLKMSTSLFIQQIKIR